MKCHILLVNVIEECGERFQMALIVYSILSVFWTMFTLIERNCAQFRLFSECEVNVKSSQLVFKFTFPV